MTQLMDLSPKLHAFVHKAQANPKVMADELRESPLAAIAPVVGEGVPVAKSSLPIVTAHGMGDSCFNPGMDSITKYAGRTLGVYARCIPTGSNIITDTIYGFLMNMDRSVDVFAKAVKADPKLAGGFNAFGTSQGNNIIRGYITKYNDPPVVNFMSICGINAGVAAFPHCSPQTPLIGGVCEAFTEVLGALAYNSLVQSLLFQADYFRDPERTTSSSYLENSQLAKWNGETSADMSTFKVNWARTSKFVWVMGDADTMVWPREGEHWGAPPTDYPKTVKPMTMQQTSWYKGDTFGLRTADEAGKNAFETFHGEHIQFTEKDLKGWLLKYFSA
eukprot:CAMPEP_0119315410 /NCGR_PEP_ID=MMETSP1333-20130426/35745_1 /TAXON_ID=418940 /ORGANISM="Scyphosphaera apsteinii, Strain RCC1455" /LENGTH=331 /DNA_ID=CAMNT_0007320761 /DNA_START=108 /DNA_END=1103 /DNA_ORIENTATION=-